MHKVGGSIPLPPTKFFEEKLGPVTEDVMSEGMPRPSGRGERRKEIRRIGVF